MKKPIIKIISYVKAFAIAFITVIYSLLSLITIVLKKPKWYFKLAKSWSSVLLKASGIRISTVGSENIQKDESYIFISNHSSHFDIPVLLSSLSDMVSLVYKEELEKIPVFGYALAKSPHISINRTHPKKAIESINNAVKHLETGASVLIFPEGTRSKDGNMGEFKRGAFMVASRSGKPIIPVSVSGTFPLLPKDGFNILGGNVTVKIHDVIDDYQIDSPADEKELMKRIKNIIENNLK
jgi:1-acyl-sn-glycerol-3-phosphate acyltransferase